MLRRIIYLLVLGGLIAACGPTSVDQQTLTAHDGVISTERADIYATATVAAERIQITIEFAAQQIRAVGTEGGLMLSTLQARGVDVSDLPDPISPTPAPVDLNITRTPTSTGAVNVVVQPQPTRDPNSTPTPVQITPPFTPSPPPRPTRNVVADVPQLLQGIELASSVGNDDCAVNPTTEFTPQTAEIYIVARAVELPEGTTVTTRWQRGDEQVALFDFTYDYVEDACIWFYSDQTNFDFIPGDYRITVEVNGLPLGEPLPFTIVEPNAS